MSSSTTLNSVLSALGGSTGIDVTSAVDAILYADRAPERAWQTQQTALTNQATAINQLETESSSLSDALNALQGTTGALDAVSATSSDTSVLSATAAAGTSASSHTIVVKNLASTGQWYTDAEPSSSAQLSSGSFQITSGANSTTLSIGGTSGINSLDDLAASINSQSLGVTANVITGSTGARLSLVSQSSGSAGDFSISQATGLGFTQANAGADASLTIDGVPVTSATNTVSGAITGVTLNLQSVSTTAGISLQVAPDTTSITSAVSTFVTAYNTLIKDVNSQFVFNTATGTSGTLSGDSTIRGLQAALLATTNYTSSSGALQTLQSLGVSTNQDGTLTLNTTTLASAVQSNNSAVQTFFQGTASDGFVASLYSTLDTYTDPTEGAFTVDLSSLSSEYQDLTDQTNTLELYLSSQKTILTQQYNTADIALQQLPQKLKQIQALLNPNSSSS